MLLSVWRKVTSRSELMSCWARLSAAVSGQVAGLRQVAVTVNDCGAAVVQGYRS